jgi:predicted RNase H-like HicB family nuclease
MATVMPRMIRRTTAADEWRSDEIVPEPTFMAATFSTDSGESGERPNDGVLPEQLIELYARIAVFRAVVEEIESGRWFATVPRLVGVWAEGSTPDEACADLEASVRDWVRMKMGRHHGDIPVVGGINLNRA